MPRDLDQTGADVVRYIRQLTQKSNDPYSDGFNQCHCKHQLYVLKCFIEDQYKLTPSFPEHEQEWERTRLMEMLKK